MDIHQSLDTCEQTLVEIRSHIHHPWLKGELVKNYKKFNQIFISLDTLEECYLSIKEYLKIPDITGYSGGFLYLTGLLQSLYVISDCIKSLADNTVHLKIDYKLSHDMLFYLIEVRNDVVGHPTGRRNNTMHYIDRSSITKYNFQYMTYSENGWKANMNKVNLKETLFYCLQETADLLGIILTQMECKIEAHLNAFKGMKLTATLTHTGYNIEKLIQGCTTDYTLTFINMKELSSTFQKSLDEVMQIYPTLEMLPGLYQCSDDIKYILARLEGWLDERSFRGNRDVLIFLETLSTKLDEYRSMLAEIELTLPDDGVK